MNEQDDKSPSTAQNLPSHQLTGAEACGHQGENKAATGGTSQGQSLAASVAGEGGQPPLPAPPSEELKRYWKQDLRYKLFQLIVSMVGFILVIVGLVFNFFQSGNVAKSTRANVGHSILTHVTNLDKVFIDKPHLMPYFYDNEPIEKTNEKFPEVRATAVMVLDVFDLVVTQNRHFPEYWDKPQAWDEWMIDVFSTSPILRVTFRAIAHEVTN